MFIIKGKVDIFSFFGDITFFQFKKQHRTNVTKCEVYAFIRSGNWLQCLESTHLRHQLLSFSPHFS